MTLRHRLLLVYGIVVLLSIATVAISTLEVENARRVFGALQYWNEIVFTARDLEDTFEPQAEPSAEQLEEMLVTVSGEHADLAQAGDYLDVDEARGVLNELKKELTRALAEPAAVRDTREIRRLIQSYVRIVESQLYVLIEQRNQQEVRKALLVAGVITLTTLHIGAIGWLLRRWLLHPMEQLNRQVEALGRDQPPPEPLLGRPQELANLAVAMDRARESLGSLRQQLLESERLTTIGQLAAQLAHNLRNPLASIRAMAQVTERRESSSPETRQRMAEIVASVDRLNQWIAGLMEVARREPSAGREQDVVPLLYRIRDSLSTEAAAKDLTLQVDAPTAGILCSHDPATLEHALIAMVTNAIEASPLGGHVSISAARAQAGDGSICRISVHDQGAGLPHEAPQRIFEFSYSTKQKGMGLGLALARQALQRQGGAVGARNDPAGGATVYVELPIADRPAPGVSEVEAEPLEEVSPSPSARGQRAP